MLHTNVYLQSLTYQLPPNVVSTSSLYERLAPTLKRLGIPGSWLSSLSGVQERRLWDKDTNLADVATVAARDALEKSGLQPEDIGCLICTSVSKEFVEPSLACMVHHGLNLPSTTLNFDIANACLAFINGMSQMAQMIDQGCIKAAIIVDAECSRSVVENTLNRMTKPDIDLAGFSKNFAGLTLGSGAVAAVLVNGELAHNAHRIRGHVALSDTRYCRHCIGSMSEILTDQTSLMKAGIELAARTWLLASQTFGWTCDNVQQFICHQVGAQHHKLLFDKLGLDFKKSFQTFPFLGNVGPASVPMTLAMAAEQGRLHPNDRVGLMGIGSGLNCSMMEIVW
ncbi:MAG: 3-oxoacyl-ACP synthase III [bacterium]|nr:3-oxoacyl-ACP synthase III [bacterium]